MARYIEAVECAEIISEKFNINLYDLIDVFAEIPTVDVVPKSEVENLIYKLECLLCHSTGNRLSKHTYDLRTMEAAVTDYIQESYDKGCKYGQADVAKKIFEDIEKNYADFLFDGCRNIIVITEKDYDELKNKYTENGE